jgi:hypothetical protein
LKYSRDYKSNCIADEVANGWMINFLVATCWSRVPIGILQRLDSCIRWNNFASSTTLAPHF